MDASMDVDMDGTVTLAALDPAYPAWSRFAATRRDLMALWFLSVASAPDGTWVMAFRWWEPGERFPASAAARLGAQMRESILSGELAEILFIHINPFAEQEAESGRMTLLFRDLADFVRHSGGFEARAAAEPWA